MWSYSSYVRYNVGALKTAQCTSHQQCLVAEWLGRSVTVRVKVRAGAKEWNFFLSVSNVTKTLSWCGIVTNGTYMENNFAIVIMSG